MEAFIRRGRTGAGKSTLITCVKSMKDGNFHNNMSC